WSERVAEFELASVDGDWHQVVYLAKQGDDVDQIAGRAAAGRAVCRLACAPRGADAESWSDGADVGLQLVGQIAPHLPEFCELLWERARVGGDDEESSPVDAAIAQTVAKGQANQLKHSVFALTAALDDRIDSARTHCEL